MNFKLIIKEEALEDTLHTYLWYEKKTPGLGAKFENALDDAYDLLEEIPFSFQVKIKEYRKIHLRTFPYSAVYEIDDKHRVVTVFAVIGQKDNPAKLEERLED